MQVPTHLKHEPIIGVPFYSKKDGIYKGLNRDAKALSIGIAQYEQEEEYSVKVFRYNDDSQRWSRQSEELPLHRVLDLAILLVTTIVKEKVIDYNSDNLEEEIINQNKLEGLFEYLNSKEQKNELRPRLIELRKHIDNALKNY